MKVSNIGSVTDSYHWFYSYSHWFGWVSLVDAISQWYVVIVFVF